MNKSYTTILVLLGVFVIFGVISTTSNFTGKATTTSSIGSCNGTQITPTCCPDIDGYGSVDVKDLNILKAAYGSKSGSSKYNFYADINKDKTVNIFDMNVLKANYGKYTDCANAYIATCADSDNGIKEYMPGSITLSEYWYRNDSTSVVGIYKDYCYNSQTLYEYYCSTYQSGARQIFQCENGCYNFSSGAACIQNVTQCTEGWKCKDSVTKAYQYSNCNWVSETYCPEGCSFGKCNTGNQTICITSTLFVNTSIIVFTNKNLILDNVASNSAILVNVNGVAETISANSTKMVNGVEVTNKKAFYSEIKSQRYATLDIGAYSGACRH